VLSGALCRGHWTGPRRNFGAGWTEKKLWSLTPGAWLLGTPLLGDPIQMGWAQRAGVTG
jgi:hypothetical protein